MLVCVDAVASEDFQDLGADILAMADAVARAAEDRRRDWLEESAAAFAAQAEWHDRLGHPSPTSSRTPAEQLGRGPNRSTFADERAVE